MKKELIKGTEMEYIFNWIFAGGKIGQPFNVDKTFIRWLRNELDEDGVRGVLEAMHKYDFDKFNSAERYLKLKEASEYAKKETA